MGDRRQLTKDTKALTHGIDINAVLRGEQSVPTDIVERTGAYVDDGVIHIGGFHLTNVDLVAMPGATEEDFKNVGLFLDAMRGKINVWIGIWLNEAETTYKKTNEQLSEWLGYDVSTLHNMKSTMSKVSLRSEKFTFTHYTIIAPLEDEQQRRLVQWAESQPGGVSVALLREQRYAWFGRPGAALPSGELTPLIEADVADNAVKALRKAKKGNVPDRATLLDLRAWIDEHLAMRDD